MSATAPEILRLAAAIRGKTAKTARVNTAALQSRSVEQYARENLRLPCPVLEDRACSEYLTRPLVCRAVLSKSLETCLQIFDRNAGGAFTAADASTAVRTFCTIILRAGLILGGLPHQHLEMKPAGWPANRSSPPWRKISAIQRARCSAKSWTAWSPRCGPRFRNTLDACCMTGDARARP